MEIVTVREYARRIGVSLTAIQKGIKSGRIEAQKDDTGRVTGIDWATQEHAWAENSKAPQRMPKTLSGGRPRTDGKPVATPATQGGKSEQKPTPAGQMTLAEVQRAREIVKLQLDNLKLKEAQAELVPAADVRKQGHALAAGIISSLYNIPDRCADEIAGMTDPHAIHTLLLREIDQSIEKIRGEYAS